MSYNIAKIFEIMGSFENAKPRLRIELRNRNSIGKETPYKNIATAGDICMVAKVEISEPEDRSVTTAAVDNSTIEKWGITPEELFEAAVESCQKARQPHFMRLDSIVGNTISGGYPAYALTNLQAVNGAACICYEGLLEEIAGRFESGFWILPSSVHEVIIVPGEWSLPDSLAYKEMVSTINLSEYIVPDEVLSDHPMYYDRENRLYAY